MSKWNIGGLGLLSLALLVGCDGEGSASNPLTPAAADAAVPVEVAAPAAVQPAAVDLPTAQAPEFLSLVAPTRQPAEFDLHCRRVAEAPVIDGLADDSAWAGAAEIVTLDYSSQRPIAIRAVHTGDHVYFLVKYPDAAASTTHKSWLWHAEEQVYKAMGDREDMLVMKFSMVGNKANISFRDPEPHRADIWFWKACRTNASGFADDKSQALGKESGEETVEVPAPRFGTLHLTRKGDAGEAAYTDTMPIDYQGPLVPGFVQQAADGSRADIAAKGVWRDGFWTIEFSRMLNTGHRDDIQLEAGGRYLFGVSCYEIAYSPIDPKVFQPIYKTGDVFDRLTLCIDR